VTKNISVQTQSFLIYTNPLGEKRKKKDRSFQSSKKREVEMTLPIDVNVEGVLTLRWSGSEGM
jgi:hypothetical protein